MKWFYNLSKQAQIAICFITAAVSILWIAIFAVMEQLILTIIGIVIFAVAIFFIYCYSRAEKNRRAEQAAANPKTKECVQKGNQKIIIASKQPFSISIT